MIYPEFPKHGDVIGICAPSAGVGDKTDEFDLSIDTLHEAGFETFETASVRNCGCPSADAAERGAEFNSLFADDDVAMVMSAAGGDYNIEMLPYIDEETVRGNPKWFAGYSDPTSIELFLTTKLDIASIYGVNAGAWDWRPLHEFQLNSLSVLKGDIPLQHSYEFWASMGYNEETGGYEMDAPVEWTLLVPAESEAMIAFPADDACESEDELIYETIIEQELTEADFLDVSGRLIGGCADVMDWVIGTPYEDLKGFAERYKEDGLIWFFDNFELNPMNLMYLMIKMKHMGLFEHAKAVIFGRPCFRGDAEDIDYLERLERVFCDTDVPVIWGADIGHTKPSFTLINGAIGHLVYRNGEAELQMFLK